MSSPCSKDHLDRGIDLAGEHLARPGELGVVLRLGRELELAAADEIAVDTLLRDELLNRLHRRFVGAVVGAGALGTDAPGERASAADRPVKPPPITATSTRPDTGSPSSRVKRGAVSSQ
jgi:hypothetical protein